VSVYFPLSSPLRIFQNPHPSCLLSEEINKSVALSQTIHLQPRNLFVCLPGARVRRKQGNTHSPQERSGKCVCKVRRESVTCVCVCVCLQFIICRDSPAAQHQLRINPSLTATLSFIPDARPPPPLSLYTPVCK
jgi:hypothetical protein